MAEVMEVLKLVVDASGALQPLAATERAMDKTGTAAVTMAGRVNTSNAAFSKSTAGVAAYAQSQLEAARRTQAAIETQQRLNVAMQTASAVTGNSTVALLANASAMASSTVATGAAAGAATALGRALSLVGGPLGVVLLATQAASLAFDVFRDRQAKAAAEAKKTAEQFNKLSTAAKDAALSTQLASAESARSGAERTFLQTGQAGDVAGNRAAFADMQAAAVRVAELSDKLEKLRATTTAAAGVLGVGLANAAVRAREETEAFAKAGEIGAAAYRMAADEWARGARDARTLGAALRDNDPIAQSLVKTATDLAKAEAARDAAMNPEKVAKMTAAQKEALAFQQAYSASLIGTLSNIADAEMERADAAAKAQAAAEASNSKRTTSIQFELSQMALRTEMIAATGDELRQLELRYEFLQRLSQGYGITTAAAFTSAKQAMDDATESAKNHLKALQLIADLSEKDFANVANANVSVKFKGASAAQGVAGTALGAVGQDATGAFGSFVGAAFGSTAAAAFRTFSDVLDLSGEKARQAAAAQAEYARALDDFVLTSRTNLQEELRNNLNRANQMVVQAGVANGATVSGTNFKSADEIEAFLAIIRRAGPQMRGLSAALAELVDKTRENEQFIRERNAAELKAASEDFAVRALRAQGLDAEAEALAFATQQSREREAFEKKYGETVEYGNLVKLQAIEAEKRLADERKKALEKAETERRSIFDNLNAGLAFTDPRGAADAAFAEAQARRLFDAIARGASDAEQSAIRFRNAAEAAARATEQLAADTATRNGFLAQIAAMTGNTRVAEDLTRATANAQAIADAVKSGMSDTNLLLLQAAQLIAEEQVKMNRAIEDGTKRITDKAANDTAAINLLIDVTRTVGEAELARLDTLIADTQRAAKESAKQFDAQIAAAREQAKATVAAIDVQRDAARSALEAARQQITALEKSTQTNQAVVDALKGFRDSVKLGDLSTLSPEGKLAEARRQFDAITAAAQAGNADAAQQLPGAGQNLLQASRAFNASNAGFVADFDRVLAVTNAIEAQFGATLPTDLATLEQVRRSAEGIERTLTALDAQKDAVQRASEKEIAALQAAKQTAADGFAALLEQYQGQRDKVAAQMADALKKLDAQKLAIETAAQQEIAALTAFETEAFKQRAAQIMAAQNIAGLTAQALAEARRQTDMLAQVLNVPRPSGPDYISGPDGPANFETAPGAGGMENNPMLATLRSIENENKALRTELRGLRDRIEQQGAASIEVAANVGEEVVNAERATAAAVRTVAATVSAGTAQIVAASRGSGRVAR